MTPQEASDEDRMVTQAEYGAEIDAETSEKDPSELQYITPIDYAKRIEELDEDLRDAAEILVEQVSMCRHTLLQCIMWTVLGSQAPLNRGKDEASGRATKMKRLQSTDMSPKEPLMHTTGHSSKISSVSSVRS